MSELLGSPASTWMDGVHLMNKLSMHLPGSVENSSPMNAIEEKIQPAVRGEKDAGNLITRLIRWNPEERPTTEEALAHEYFSAVGEPKTKLHNAKSEQKLPPNKTKAKNDSDLLAFRQGRNSKRSMQLSKPSNEGNAHLMSVTDKTLSGQAGLSEDRVSSRFKIKQLPASDEQNEFCEYLNAITSFTDGVDVNGENSFQPFDQRGPLQPKFTPSERYRPRSMLSDSTPCKPSMYSVAQTIARSTKRRGGRKSLNKSSSRRRSSEKPRWLLSNQNMGRRAVEVRVGHSSFAMEADNNHLLDPRQITQHMDANQKEEQRDSVWNPF